MSSLQLRNIRKSFGRQDVLKGVSLTISPGEVHALLGANGAGKSTLMKILSGDYSKDSGTITLNGSEVSVASPRDAIRLGIEMVVQEPDTALVPSLTVAENVTMEDLLSGPSFISWNNRRKKARQHLQLVGLSISTEKLISECSLAEKQLILLARALSKHASFIILDEPTAALSQNETDRLFSVINSLKKQGIGFVFISHRLPEIFKLCDRITVLKDGNDVLSAPTTSTNADEVIQHMIGELLILEKEHVTNKKDAVLLEAHSFHVPKTGQNVSFKLHEGEVVGIAGLVGAGKTETARALFGADLSPDSLSVHGVQKRWRSPKDAVANGLSFVPEERRKEGIITSFSLRDNLAIPSFSKFTSKGFLSSSSIEKAAAEWIQKLGIKAESTSVPAGLLSGGNQQKAAIGKWLLKGGDIFLFDEPTKGIDIGAKEDVFSLIKTLASEGKGILYFTSELNELFTVADRILVLYNGEITAQFTREEATYEKIMHAATGGQHVTAISS
ncbi:sugar ABC transporter ATP-binding protein [Fictibacillus aquaticus]|uniref:sugar ABC transporter ATP-binding protein n=1 Tax=Fictibacillus aquaticus TaxID=2021314 RepID=UPI001F0A3332|nr:sugar ABC transporter ATP-binding protein [Fictibacillus aquaticus]